MVPEKDQIKNLDEKSVLPSSHMTPHFSLRPSSWRSTFCHGSGTHYNDLGNHLEKLSSRTYRMVIVPWFSQNKSFAELS